MSTMRYDISTTRVVRGSELVVRDLQSGYEVSAAGCESEIWFSDWLIPPAMPKSYNALWTNLQRFATIQASFFCVKVSQCIN